MSVSLPLLPPRYRNLLVVGKLTLPSRVFQSPLAGVTDQVFRRLVRRWARDSMLYTEMVHAAGLQHQRGHQIMAIAPDEQPISIQLFDCRPTFMAEAAQLAVAEGAWTIDLNMGCPVNKITRKGGGSSLIRQPEVAEAIVRTVVAAVDVPVTVKTRIGWSNSEITILDFARRMEDAGASMITVHGRTREQGYQGPACWDWIRQVKEQLSIPVIANGDIISVEAAVHCLNETGADGVMVARGSLGRPSLVGEIEHYLHTGDRLPEPTPLERLEMAIEHQRALVTAKGDRGFFQARKHLSWYCRGFRGANELRDQLMRTPDLAASEALLAQTRTVLSQMECNENQSDQIFRARLDGFGVNLS